MNPVRSIIGSPTVSTRRSVLRFAESIKTVTSDGCDLQQNGRVIMTGLDITMPFSVGGSFQVFSLVQRGVSSSLPARSKLRNCTYWAEYSRTVTVRTSLLSCIADLRLDLAHLLRAPCALMAFQAQNRTRRSLNSDDSHPAKCLSSCSHLADKLNTQVRLVAPLQLELPVNRHRI